MARSKSQLSRLAHVALLLALVLAATLLPGRVGADPVDPPVHTDVIVDPGAPASPTADEPLADDPNSPAEPVDLAAVEPSANEWSQSDPTAWWWYYNQTPAQVGQLLTTNSARLVDIEVQQISPLLFTVAMVRNSGTYGKSWWWYYGLSASELRSALTSNSARLIDIETYVVNGVYRFAVVMVSNTGAEAKSWWYYYGTTLTTIVNAASQNNARLIDVDTYLVGTTRRYSAIMISNTGADARAWWHYYNVTPAYITEQAKSKNARVIDIEPHDVAAGTFTVLLEACPCTYWWWYYGLTENQVNNLWAQNGARIIDIEQYTVNGNRRFAVAMINNSNAVTTRVGQMLRSGTDGATGLYLKRVNGTVEAALQERRIFEPASTIKVVPHLYAMRQVQAGNIALTTPIVRYAYSATSCPGTNTSGTDSLSTALREMMRNSDNARTRAVVDTFGLANINAMADAIGMTGTNINHVIGCGGPTPNELTLADAGLLYERVANGALLNATNRSHFYARMAGKAYDFTGIWADVQQIVEQEAPPAMTPTEKASFKTAFQTWYKAGGYTICTNASCSTVREYRSVAGTARVPFCTANGVLSSRRYVFGTFIDAATNTTNANNTFNQTKSELLREPIRAALQTWAPCGD